MRVRQPRFKNKRILLHVCEWVLLKGGFFLEVSLMKLAGSLFTEGEPDKDLYFILRGQNTWTCTDSAMSESRPTAYEMIQKMMWTEENA